MERYLHRFNNETERNQYETGGGNTSLCFLCK